MFSIVSLCILLPLIKSQCDSQQFLYGDTCILQCPIDTFVSNGELNNECIQCDITRNLVLNQDRTECVCSRGTYLTQDKYQCLACHYSCLSCKGSEFNQCLTCDTQQNITLREWIRGACVCPIGYFDNSEILNPVCEKCHTDCYTCNGPDQLGCIKCSQNRIKDQQGFCICINNLITDSKGFCSCPYPLVDQMCINPDNKCRYGEQYVKLDKIQRAGKKGKPFQCRCRPGLVKIKGQCRSCEENQTYNPKKQICQCTGHKHQGKCIICSENQVFKKKIGECICQKNYFLNENNQCIKAQPKQIYINGQFKCIPNYYRKNSSGKCFKCKKKSDHQSCTSNNIDIPRELSINQITRKERNRPIFIQVIQNKEQIQRTNQVQN